MSKRLSVSLLLLALLPAAQAQTCYPASIAADTPTSRFTDNGDGTVTDTATALMWKRCAEGMAWNGSACTGTATYYTWQGALQRPGTLNVGGGFAGHTDWRLPNINELRSIVERQCSSPAINVEIFPNTPASYFWSASPVAGNSNGAWVVGFGNGNNGWDDRYDSYYVRLVRAGQ